MSEGEQTLDDIRKKLQKTEKEQRKIEGGKGKSPYKYSEEDAVDALQDWGTSGDLPQKDVSTVVRKKSKKT